MKLISKGRRGLKSLKKFLEYCNKKKAYLRFRDTIKVNDNAVLFCSFAGNNYSCNPRAIYEEMVNNPKYSNFQFIWAFKSPKKYKYLEQPNTTIVKYGSKDHFNACAFTKYWVNNYTMHPFIWPKNDQVYIHTWHGKPIKKIGSDVLGDLTNWTSKKTLRKRYKNDAKKMTYFLSGSRYYDSCMTKAFRLNKVLRKKLVHTGYPRNSKLFTYTTEDIINIKRKLSIGLDKKVILYAPTWRPQNHIEKAKFWHESHIDFTSLRAQLGNDYIILYRTHHMVCDEQYPAGVIPVNEYDDANELYIISDLMISDYSGTIFDFANLKRPMIFYLFDREKYESLPGVYFDLNELPGTIVTDEKELVPVIKKSIADFLYDDKYKAFNEKHNPYEGPDCTKNTLKLCFHGK